MSQREIWQATEAVLWPANKTDRFCEAAMLQPPEETPSLIRWCPLCYLVHVLFSDRGLLALFGGPKHTVTYLL